MHTRAEAERNLLVPTIEALRRHAPFDRMARAHLEFLAKHLRLAFYPKGEIITHPQRGPTRTLYIIKQGRVRGELEGARRSGRVEVWELEAGECFPIGAMLGRRAVIMQHRAAADTFCFELDRDDFEKLLALSPVFNDFCSRRLANLLAEALRGLKSELAEQEGEAWYDVPLTDVIRCPPVTCELETPLREALARMHAERVSSIVAVDAGRQPLGIFSVQDLLARAAARDLSLDAPVETVMTPNPVALAPSATAHEAMVAMARHAIGHVCVVDEGRLVGVLRERDLFSLQRVGVTRLARAITSAPDLATLISRKHDVRELVEHMLVHGTSVAQLMEIVALLNDHVMRRVIALCSAEHGTPSATFAWLSFGSEGRQEQTVETRQENGILFQVPAGRSVEEVRGELVALARRVNAALTQCGYVPGDNNVIASNPECCLTFEEWRARFGAWIERGAPEHWRQTSRYFDFRALEGDPRPAEGLRRWVLDRAVAAPRFLRRMAESALGVEPPIGLLPDLSGEVRAGYADAIDVGLRGTLPFVDGARLLALANGMPQTNTLARLRAAAERRVVRQAEAQAWCDAYAFIQLLRMRRHQAQLRAGQAADDFVDPQRLNELDRRVLKEAFRQARKFQAFLAMQQES